jgi:Recombinase.
MHDPNDRQEWIIDEETAPIVQRIFRSIINGKSMSKIADELTAEGKLTPNAYWKSTGATVSRGAHNDNPTKWSIPTIIVILKKEEYMGWKILNKTGTDSYKSKKREQTAPESSRKQ